MLSLVVAIDKNWGIGKDGKLLISIPNDMKFFKDLTMGHSIIMGRKTLESFPNREPLKGRKNIVLSTTCQLQLFSNSTGCECNKQPKKTIEKNIKVFHSIDEVLFHIRDKKEEIFVIGGSSIYEQFLPYCEIAYVTKMEETFDSDSFFPNLKKQKDWELIESSKIYSWNNINYYFCKYKNKKTEIIK